MTQYEWINSIRKEEMMLEMEALLSKNKTEDRYIKYVATFKNGYKRGNRKVIGYEKVDRRKN